MLLLLLLVLQLLLLFLLHATRFISHIFIIFAFQFRFGRPFGGVAVVPLEFATKTFIAAILHTKCMQQAKCIYLRTTFDFDAAQQATRMLG